MSLCRLCRWKWHRQHYSLFIPDTHTATDIWIDFISSITLPSCSKMVSFGNMKIEFYLLLLTKVHTCLVWSLNLSLPPYPSPVDILLYIKTNPNLLLFVYNSTLPSAKKTTSPPSSSIPPRPRSPPNNNSISIMVRLMSLWNPSSSSSSSS